MSRINISRLIVLFIVVLLALIGIQYYWIKNAIQLIDNTFDQQVHQSLREIVERLERQEAIDKLRSHKHAKFLFVEDSTTNYSENFPDTGFEFIITKEISKEKDGISIVKKNKWADATIDEQTKIDQISANELIKKGENFFVDDMKMEFAKEKIVPTSQDKPNNILKEKIGKKTAIVGDIVKRLMEVNLYEKITERIDPSVLDSMIRYQLNENEVNTEFVFSILNKNKNTVAGRTENFEIEISNSPYNTRLFPGDIIESGNTLALFFPKRKTFLLSRIKWVLALSIIIVLGLIVIMSGSIMAILKQKRLSEIKNDFINNMTHELKTPISTIALAHEALSDSGLKNQKDIADRYIKIIGEENQRLGALVQNVLQHAVLDKGNFELKKQAVNLHDLIGQVVNNFSLVIQEKNGMVGSKLNAGNAVVLGDVVHLRNMLNNLLDNAIKYSPNEPVIEIITENIEENFVLKITDNGIGIKKEDQTKIFEKLYRVPTGNIHDVKGFGLGLSYVKIIVEKHGGKIKVNSQTGMGSTFIIQIPFKNE